MTLTNYVFIIVGGLVAILGILSFFIPSFTRIISSPGNPRTQAIIATIIGLIFLIIGLVVELPTNS